MAPKKTAPATPGLKAALKVVNQLGRSFTREADADYAVALSALGAGKANLSKQTRALTRDLISGQLGKTTSLRRLAAEAAERQGVVNRQQQGTVSRYGGALGQSVAQSFAGARAGAAGTAALGASALRAGKQTMGVAQTVGGIAAAGVSAQHEAAKYAMAQALQQRAIIDNQTLAGLTGDLYSQAMQYNMQWTMWKKQQAYARKLAEKEANEQTAQFVDGLGGTATELGGWLKEWVYTETGAGVVTDEPINISEALQAYAESLGYSSIAEVADDPAHAQDQAIISATLSIMNSQGVGSEQATTMALDKLFGGLPGWDRYSAPVLTSVEQGIGLVPYPWTPPYDPNFDPNYSGGGGTVTKVDSRLAGVDTRGQAEQILMAAGVPAEERSIILAQNGF